MFQMSGCRGIVGVVRRVLGMLACVAGSACPFTAGPAHAQTHPFTLDDYLGLEATGAGAGQGARIVWEQAPPYDEIGYYGHDHIGAWGSSGFTLQTVDLGAGTPTAAPLFEPEPGASYWFDSFSPDGRYIAFYGAKEGVFFMGAYDTETKRVRTFAESPLVDWSQGRESVWVSPEEFIFSAYVDGAQPLAAIRPYTGQRLAAEWDKAWHGEVSVSVESTGLDETDAPRWKEGRLYRANARTGALTLLAEGKFESLHVSADGRYLAALRQADLPPPDPDQPDVDWVRTRSQLTLFDLSADAPDGPSGVAIVPDKLVFIETLAWAPDANRLAFFAWNEGESVQSGIFYALDAETGEITPYPHSGLDLASERERGFSQKPERVLWVDGRLAVLARPHEGEEPRLTYRDITRPGLPGYPGKADWFLVDAQGGAENLTSEFEVISAVPLDAGAETLTILADGDVWRVGPGREPQNLTASIEPELSLPLSMRYSTSHRPFTGKVILVSRDAEQPGFALIDFETDEATFVASPAPDAEPLAGTVEAGALLFRHDDDRGAGLMLKFADGREVVVDRLNEHMADVTKTVWTTISYTVQSHVGERELESCVLLPVDYVAGTRYPVIVEIYPSRGANCTRPSSQKFNAIGRGPGPYSEHLLAAQGYIVFQPNTSAEVTQTQAGPLGGMADIVEQDMQALVEQGYADPDRIGLLGFSQGGFSSLWLATQSAIFKATVSLNGWADMYSHYFDATLLQYFYSDQFGFNGSASRYESTAGTDFPIGKKPYKDPMAYVQPSPLFNAPSVSAPILLIHSDMDGFSLDQYERMYVALNLLGKPAKFLRYWGEGHAPSSPGNIRHMWNEIFDWYDLYLSNIEQ